MNGRRSGESEICNVGFYDSPNLEKFCQRASASQHFDCIPLFASILLSKQNRTDSGPKEIVGSVMPPERMHPFDLPIQRILVDLETRLPPWMKLVSPSDESAFARLSNEIVAFADLVSPTHKERLVRKHIIERLQTHVHKVWPAATIVPIGSYAQELYTSSRYPHCNVVDIVTWICSSHYQRCLNLSNIWRFCTIFSTGLLSPLKEPSALSAVPGCPSSNTQTLMDQVHWFEIADIRNPSRCIHEQCFGNLFNTFCSTSPIEIFHPSSLDHGPQAVALSTTNE
jgi:hypothetical protein